METKSSRIKLLLMYVNCALYSGLIYSLVHVEQVFTAKIRLDIILIKQVKS